MPGRAAQPADFPLAEVRADRDRVRTFEVFGSSRMRATIMVRRASTVKFARPSIGFVISHCRKLFWALLAGSRAPRRGELAQSVRERSKSSKFWNAISPVRLPIESYCPRPVARATFGTLF